MIRLLRSATTDLDADAHASLLVDHFGAADVGVVTDEWPLIVRAGLRLRRSAGDVLVTFGAAALLAAAIKWRGRLIHVPVGRLGRVEAFAMRRRPRATVVASTFAAADDCRRAELTAQVVPPPFVPTSTDRSAARRRLGIADDVVTLALPGTIRPGSGHRLGIWASAILAYREPSWRFVLGPRGNLRFAREFVAATIAPEIPAVRIAQGEDDALAAADVAVFCGDGVPERSAIDATLARGLGIVARRSLWEREGLPTPTHVSLFEASKVRGVIRAIVRATDAVEAGRRAEPAAITYEAAERWTSLLT